MCRMHEVTTDHGENHTKSVLSRELHTLLELVLKDLGVETTSTKWKIIDNFKSNSAVHTASILLYDKLYEKCLYYHSKIKL